MFCPNCGRDGALPTSDECPVCGHELAMKECPECSGEVYNPPGISEGHRKCKSCGTWFDKV